MSSPLLSGESRVEMESRHMLMSALGVGIGVGVGFGLASGSQAVSKWAGGDAVVGVTPYTMELEMLSLISNGGDSTVTFDKFPYYLRFTFCRF